MPPTAPATNDHDDDAPSAAAESQAADAQPRGRRRRRGGRRHRRSDDRRDPRDGASAEPVESDKTPADRPGPTAPDDDWLDEMGIDAKDLQEPTIETHVEHAPEEVDVDVELDVDEEQADEPRGRRRRRRGGRRDGREEEAVEVVADTDEKPTARAKKPRREMIINVAEREECRIAILEDGKLEEIYLERASAGNYVGNIYKGVVTNVEASIQAAFIDFGQGKNGFLHVSDVHPQYFPNGGDAAEKVGRKTPRRNRPPIQRCLRRGQELLVQITKEGIGTKGPTLTTYLSIPGRYMVMLPGMRKAGVSRKIEDDATRRKLREVLAELELPDNMGFIARTAAADRTTRELQSDLRYLSRLWQAVENRIKRMKAPAELYRESDLVTRTIRDVYTSDIDRILVDNAEIAERAREFLNIFNPKAAENVEVYDGAAPVFHHFGIEAELDRLHSRTIPLKSGGSLVIDQTEALVAIDVNSGSFRTEADAEMTAFKINQEAAGEIARQLRLRDLGGVIVCDFIDMRFEKHKRAVERRLADNLKEHKERAKVLRMSAFGMIELTRQRQRASLTRSVYSDCACCRGTGIVKTIESVALDVMRIIQLAFTKSDTQKVEVTVSTAVANLLQNRKRAAIVAIESSDRQVAIISDATAGPDQVSVTCVDARGRAVPFNHQEQRRR